MKILFEVVKRIFMFLVCLKSEVEVKRSGAEGDRIYIPFEKSCHKESLNCKPHVIFSVTDVEVTD